MVVEGSGLKRCGRGLSGRGVFWKAVGVDCGGELLGKEWFVGSGGYGLESYGIGLANSEGALSVHIAK